MPFKFLKLHSIQRTLGFFCFLLFSSFSSNFFLISEKEMAGVSWTQQSFRPDFHRASDRVMEINIHTPEGQVSWTQTRFLAGPRSPSAGKLF